MREHVPPQGVVDLSEIADAAIATLKPIAEAASVRLNFTSQMRPATVIGDRDEIAQVAQNLIQNAIKYGRQGGRVDISIVPVAGRLALSVKDDGIGIAREHLPRLTERFYRVSAKDSRERGGTGLGLAIVKHIVARHRGELRIESTLGEGSTFTVLLPALENDK
jgi:two-component system phosphate regulon sensor histidine kinase PhoR